MTEESKGHLPRRDYLILPLLGLLSAIALLGTTEISARRIWEAKEDSSCDLSIPFVSDRYKPNCTSRMKLAEGPWVQNSYNECGYRSASSCRAKPPSTIRIALLGASDAEGFFVPYPQTFASLSEKILTQECGRPVEFQNLGVAGVHLLEESRRVDEALTLDPDALFFLITPSNMALDIAPQDIVPKPDTPNPSRRPPTLAEKYGLHADTLRLKVILRQSTAFSVIRYYYYQDDQVYLRLQLKTYSDPSAVLRVPFSPNWQMRFASLDSVLGYMASQVRPRGIPFAVISSLSRPQAALLSSRAAFPELDPFAFDRQVAKITAKHGILDFKMIDDFSQHPHATSLFYVSDGHMNASGQEVFARSLTRQILKSQILLPAGCAAAPDSD
jgi:hypothetical protein